MERLGNNNHHNANACADYMAGSSPSKLAVTGQEISKIARKGIRNGKK
jgi:hypothetical protein